MKQILCALLAAALLCGCSSVKEQEQPALSLAEQGELSLSYDAQNWTWAEGMEPMSFYWNETISGSEPVSVQVQLLGELEGEVDEAFLAELEKSGYGAIAGMSTQVAELRSLENRDAVYLEQSIVINDEALDLLIEQAVLTEEVIEASGGREAYFALPPSYTVTMYAQVDEQLYVFVATYSKEEQKEAVCAFLPELVNRAESIK